MYIYLIFGMILLFSGSLVGEELSKITVKSNDFEWHYYQNKSYQASFYGVHPVIFNLLLSDPRSAETAKKSQTSLIFGDIFTILGGTAIGIPLLIISTFLVGYGISPSFFATIKTPEFWGIMCSSAGPGLAILIPGIVLVVNGQKGINLSIKLFNKEI